MNKSDSIKEIAGALVKFHDSVGAVKKDSENPFFKSKYASLDNVLETIKEPLALHGLSFAQFPDANGLTTILMHSSGEWLEATYAMEPTKNPIKNEQREVIGYELTPQTQGSAITYMRRYALGAILGLATETDDDANVASTAKGVGGQTKEPFSI